MKRLLATTILAGAVLSTPAVASPGVMVGVAFDFGHPLLVDGLGVTAKVLSSDHQDQFVVGGGVSYFPFTPGGRFGLDVDAGYNFSQGAVLGGFDVLDLSPQVSGGWSYTRPRRHIRAVSDRRLKRDVRLLATLANGMRLYQFRYLRSDALHVGVMAQDLLAHPAWRHAVVRRADGFYAVDYAALGLRMARLEEWIEHGFASVIDVSAPERIAA